ncbi:ribosome maturation factor RimP [Mycobacterium sp. CBMA 234]|uniref:ribosome maturation factor RimP n=1 Tax=Mycolicibacterium sp. CBMA 234 TaxID=1918495 RepID=UPI001390BD73|nr:ribosome maturation factor RimP [Mycolicibacterium sp. CBMA 234]MUL65701.1 ribosome maturation factor RimP [Mycolicibacterium sp. CBMA 234]
MARDTPERPLPPSRLPTTGQVLELLSNAFADSGYDIEDVRMDVAARPPRIVVVADGDSGLDLDAVAELSRVASELLDQVADESEPYVLEVTSPGVERPLTEPRHYRRARGRKVELTLDDGTTVTGRLGEHDGSAVQLVVATRGKLSITTVPLEDISKAVVQVEFSPPNRRELELAGMTGEGADA